ncbi:MAG TPA: HD domain-containing protein [Bryobacteraceae bacterium]|nr:HD domain-containing protein [Bryobacteraceae bacterium]
MKTPFIKELEPNQTISTFFLVQNKEIRQKKTGDPYLSLLLCDRSGELDAKMWDNVAEVMDTFERDDFVKVKGLIQIFHNRTQLTIHKMRRAGDHEVEFADYFPASERNPDEMLLELRGIVAGMRNAHLRGLLQSLLDEPEVSRRYKMAPAAKQIHHAYLGGLIEHVLSLCGLARLAASHYRAIDLDLLLTGVVLHDIGKIYELSYERGFAYTTEGQLVGHISIAMRMLGEKLALAPDFPPKLRILVEHMILSHHGRLEFGSPKIPQFPEALLLHYLDDLDSKMECMRHMVDRDRLVEGHFTGFSTSMERSVLKKAKYLDEPEATPQPAAPAVAPSEPVRPVAPPRPHSIFADKLAQALTPDSGKGD